MKYFIALRPNKYTRAGQWWMAEEVGEMCFTCRIASGPDGTKFIQTSQIAISFDCLADVVVEHNFTIPISQAANRRDADTNSKSVIKEIADFQSENEEMIEEGFMKKKKEEFPSFASKGVFIDREKKGT